LIAGGRNTALAHGLCPGDRGLCVLPLYHINALCVSLIGALVSQGALLVERRFSLSRFWPLVAEHRVTWASLVPTIIGHLVHGAERNPPPRESLLSLRFLRSASAPLAPEMHAACERVFGIPLVETMGLTETAAQILANPLPPGERRIGSPGIAFGNAVIIGDGAGHEMLRGREGEILVRGGNLFDAYLADDQASAKAFTANGWFRTGDLGRMDGEGYVYVTGRLKELIIKGGENIAPREIDEALQADPDVLEAAAFAVACPRYGERVEAALVLKPGAVFDEARLIDHCRSILGAFKAPDRLHLLLELPRGPSGKVQRLKLADLLGTVSSRA
jgi:acyl-CoA synthetase (AMP-forming)/AMP-acid ligase II